MHPPVHPLGMVELVGGERAALRHLRQHAGHVGRFPLQHRCEAARLHAVALPAVLQQRPAVHGHDGGLARPLLGELAPAVDEVVEQRAAVGPQAREQHQVVRGHHRGDEVELEQPQAVDGGAHAGRVHARRPRLVEALGRERHAARLRRGEGGYFPASWSRSHATGYPPSQAFLKSAAARAASLATPDPAWYMPPRLEQPTASPPSHPWR